MHFKEIKYECTDFMYNFVVLRSYVNLFKEKLKPIL